MLRLKEADLIATSTTRHCYLHPEDPAKVIKIVVKKPSKPFEYDSNIKEWKYYSKLKKMYLPLDFIPQYYGFVETNLGSGLVSECIRDFDGSISVRLQKLVFHEVRYDLLEVEKKIKQLTDLLIENNIQLFDLNRFNLLIQRRADGGYKIYSIDVKGPYDNKEFIPFSTYIRYCSVQKLKRRCGRLLNMVKTARQESSALYL